MTNTIHSFNRLCRTLWQAQNKLCFYCGEELDYQKTTRDHVFPKSMGYTRSSNIVISCEPCNISKSNQFPSFEIIEKAITLYNSIGEVFHPQFTIELDGTFPRYGAVFRRIGVRRSSYRSLMDRSLPVVILGDVLAEQIAALLVES